MKNKVAIILSLVLCLAIVFTCVGCKSFSLWGDDDSSSSGLITDDDQGSSGNNSSSSSQSSGTKLPTSDAGVKDSSVTIKSVSLEGGKTESSLADVIENIHSTVVEINAETTEGTSAGSGVIVSVTENYSYIWTCQHVVDSASSIKIILTNQEEYEGIYCGGLDDQDVAVLKIAHTENMVSASIRNLETSPLRVGEDAIAIGNPLGSLGGTVTKGIVSATARELNMDGTMMTLLQTDASINSGNSGGGLFDANGLLIGIVNAKATGTSVEGLGFAIPIDFVANLANQLTETHNDPNNPYGGLGYIPGKKMIGVYGGMTTYKNQMAYYIQSVNPYGSAGSVLQAGDYVMSFNGNTLSENLGLGDILKTLNIGDSAQMVINRTTYSGYGGMYGRTQEIIVTFTIKQYVYAYMPDDE